MIGMRPGKIWFKAQKVMLAKAKGELRALSKFGAFVMRTARLSIRRRKRVSRVGEAPTNRSGALKRNIFFRVEPTRKNVVIGPTIFRRKTRDGQPVGQPTGAAVLEYGGGIRVEEYQRDLTPRGRAAVHKMGRDPDQWFRAGKKRLWHKKGQALRIRARRKRTATISARPYMHPAFEANKPKVSELFKNSIKPTG